MSTITIISKKYGTQKIDTDNFDPSTVSKGSTIFQVVEHMFNEWYDYNTQPGAPGSRDIPGMYYGECDQPAIYSRIGAIQQGIENFIEAAIESGKKLFTTKDIVRMDIEAAFE